MKNIIGIFIIIVGMAFVSCDPVENRYDLDKGLSPVTDAEIANFIKFEQQIRDGKKSNFFRFSSDGLKALTSFTHGLGTINGAGTGDQYIQCFVVAGVQDFLVKIRNADGSLVEKKYSFTVEEAFDVAPEWEILCGSGSKVWTWDDTKSAVFGNGSYLNARTPDWWQVAYGSINGQATGKWAGEGQNAKMILSASGSKLTKERNDGTTVSGTFSFDMGKKIEHVSQNDPENVNYWAIGQFSASIPILIGASGNWAETLNYNILILNENELTLSTNAPGAGAWGEAHYWLFKAVN